MEPDVIRMYSSSPPPLEDGAEEEDDEFGDFGTFSGVAASISFTEFDTPTTFNQSQALTATSPPELLNARALAKANGVAPPAPAADRTEVKKAASGSPSFPLADCNGGGAEVLTNGFATFDLQGSPSSQNSVHSHTDGTAPGDDTGSAAVCSPQDDFADFAAFSGAAEDEDCPAAGRRPDAARRASEQETTSDDEVRDTDRTGPDASGADPAAAVALAGDAPQRDEASAPDAETVCTNEPLPLPPADAADGDGSKDGGERDLSPDGAADSEAGQSDETETETSLGRPLSTDALEEFGDMSTTGSVPSPPLQGDTATPADHSQLAEDDEDEDFGDFGDAGSFGAQGFADFEQSRTQEPAGAAEDVDADDDDFGDFNSPKRLDGGSGGEQDGGDGAAFADFPVSDSFGNFSSAVGGADGTEEDGGWNAFGEQQAEGEEAWAAFGTEPSTAAAIATAPESRGGREEEEEEVKQEEEEEPAAREETTTRTDRQTVRTQSDRK